MGKQQHVLSDISIKRKITEAGRIMEAIKPQVDRLNELQAEIKTYMIEKVLPAQPLTMVSGEYVANLTAEKQVRDLTMSVKQEIYADIGHAKFLESVSIPMGTLNKLYTEAELDVMAPKHYSGGGRSFKLTKRV